MDIGDHLLLHVAYTEDEIPNQLYASKSVFSKKKTWGITPIIIG